MLYILALPCPRLFAPRNGTIVGCDVQPMYGTQCRFACNEGFVLKRGSSRRTCELSSLETRVYWTGSPPVCISKYLYKLDQVEPGGVGWGVVWVVCLFITCLMFKIVSLVGIFRLYIIMGGWTNVMWLLPPVSLFLHSARRCIFRYKVELDAFLQ